MRILLVDDHVIVRRGLKLIVEREFPGSTVGEAGNGNEALKQLRDGDWDLMVLDLNLPDTSGLDLLREIKGSSKVKVLVFSMYPERPYAWRALRAGAVGYLSKDALEEELASALGAVAAGRRYVSRGLTEVVGGELSRGWEGPPHVRLSSRESMVMLGLANGRDLREIAQSLSVSPKTVSTYRRRLLDKLGLKSNADIVRYAVENGLVQ